MSSTMNSGAKQSIYNSLTQDTLPIDGETLDAINDYVNDVDEDTALWGYDRWATTASGETVLL